MLLFIFIIIMYRYIRSSIVHSLSIICTDYVARDFFCLCDFNCVCVCVCVINTQSTPAALWMGFIIPDKKTSGVDTDKKKPKAKKNLNQGECPTVLTDPIIPKGGTWEPKGKKKPPRTLPPRKQKRNNKTTHVGHATEFSWVFFY